MLSIYMSAGDTELLPSADEILLCTQETTAEQVHCYTSRKSNKIGKIKRAFLYLLKLHISLAFDELFLQNDL